MIRAALLGVIAMLISAALCIRHVEPERVALGAPDPGITVAEVILPEATHQYVELSRQELHELAEAHGFTPQFVRHQFRYMAGNWQGEHYEIDAIYAPGIMFAINTEFLMNDEHIIFELGNALYCIHFVTRL
ncbi:MAG: hypothetical protein H0X04_00080 [Chthoniobacterales bacterium]|nr:hypothetical protein [Chthoniobacterales bacterium]